MVRRIAFAALVFLAACPAGAQAANLPDSVSGAVFLDADGNGKMDPGEKPLAGFRVTDGVNIVTTGPDGRYTVPIGQDPTTPQKGSRVVCLCWPEGYWPSGPWWARLDQIADPGKVNFGVRPQQQALPFAFLHVSDDHSAGASFNQLAPAAGQLKPLLRFAVSTGDSAGAGEDGAATLAKNSAAFVVPVMNVPGNHDIVGGHGPHRLEQTPLAGNGSYTKHLGPVRWSFDYAGCRFVGLDWMDPSIPEEINGSVPQVAAEWVEKDLKSVKPGSRIFVFVHFPSGCDRAEEVLAANHVAHVFGGHNHEHRYYRFGGAPAVTAINFMAGGNLVVVQEKDFTVGEFCLGYKGPDHHIKRCSLARMGAVLGAAGPRRMPPRTLAPGELAGGKTVDLNGAKGVQIALSLSPGSAASAGLRIAASPRPVEIVWTGTQIEVAGVPVPFGWQEYDGKTLLLNVLIDGERIEFYANKRYHLGKSLKVDAVTGVTVFAEGGSGSIKKADIAGLKGK